MIIFRRILLAPIGWIYLLITSVRNKLFDWNLFKTYPIPGKSICVGNLSTGGTGKTPHVDLIVTELLKHKRTVSILSRGYGRKTKGLLEVKLTSSAEEVGDEPLFYKTKFQENTKVIVAEKRDVGVKFIRKNSSPNDVIVLDDAFQHRAVKAGLNIIITEFSKLFINDMLLPAGNLRESKSSIKRADLIIVSKCPKDISIEKRDEIKRSINFDSSKIFFSNIEYGIIQSFANKEMQEDVENVLLVTGIGNPSPLKEHLEKHYNVSHLKYSDHHDFTEDDIAKIHEKFGNFASRNKIIITTEKDFMRLKKFNSINLDKYPWYYQPIITIIDEQQKFNLYLNEYLSTI